MRPARFHIEGLTVMAAAVELLLGLTIYALPQEFQTSVYQPFSTYLGNLGAAFVAGAVLLLVMLLYPLPATVRRMLVLIPAAPLVILAVGTAIERMWTGTVLYGLMGGAVVAAPWLSELRLAGQTRDRPNLCIITISASEAVVGGLMLLRPGLFSAAGYAAISGIIPLVGLTGLIGAAALMAPKARGPWGTVGNPLRRAAGTILPLLLVYGFWREALWSGVIAWGIWAAGLLFGDQHPEQLLRTRVAKLSARGAEDRGAALERMLETWGWVLTVIIIGLTATGTLPAPAAALGFVLAVSAYNVVVHWGLPHLGTPLQRSRWHGAFLIVAVGGVLPHIGPLQTSFSVLLTAVPLLVTRVLGAAWGRMMLGLSLAAVGLPALTEVLSGGRLMVPELLHIAVKILVIAALSLLGIRVASDESRHEQALIRVRGDLERQVHLLTLIDRIRCAIRQSLELDEVLRTTAEELGRTLGVDRCFVRLREADDAFPVAHEYTAPGVTPLGFGARECLPVLTLALRTHSVVAVADVAADARLADPALEGQADLLRLGVRAVLLAPFQVDGEVLGVIGLHQSTARDWTPNEIQVLEAVAGQVGVALAHAQVHQALAERHAQLQQVLADIQHLNRELVTRSESLEEQRNQLEQALEKARTSEEARGILADILEATTDFVATAAPDGFVQYYNKAARQMLGIGPDEDITGITVPDTHPEWAACLVLGTGIPSAIRDGVWSGETAFLSRDGRETPVSQVILAHKAPDGALSYLSTIARDITGRKQVEQALSDSLLQLQARQEELHALNEHLLAEHETVGRLTAVATAIAAGDLCRRADVPGAGELASLAQALNQMADGLKARIMERQKAGRRIFAAQEEVRRQVAARLHTSVQSKLLVLWHRLGKCEELLQSNPEEALGILAEVREGLNRLREEEVRGLSHRLHPHVVHAGLVPALEFLRDQFEGPVAVHLEVDPRLLPGSAYLSKRSEAAILAAYRLVEEALTNTVKHARAQSVTIRADLEPGGVLVVSVVDDGIGFDPATADQAGLGLTATLDYANAVGGSLLVDSVPGRGTRITARLPLSPE